MEPFKFQHECLNEMDWFAGRVLLSLEQGLGKTAISLWYLQKHPECFPAIVVCPATIKWVWQREAQNAIGVQASVAEGKTPPERGHIKTIPDILILNFDILFNRKGKKSWVDWIKERKLRTVIVDECQNISNPAAKRTKAVKELCKGVKTLLFLSGTPLLNRPIELFTSLQILRRDVFSSRWSFGHNFCAASFTPWGGWEYKGATNTKQLHELLLEEVMVRRRKAEVLKDLPRKIRQVVPLEIPNMSEYRKAKTEFLTWLRQKDPVAFQKALRSEIMTKTGYLLRLASELKLPLVLEWINEWLEEGDEKLVVFAHHQKIIKQLLEKVKAKNVLIDGSVTGRNRQLAVDVFQRDPKTRVLIGSEAAGTGITLTSASTVVMAEMGWWRPGDYVQAEDRLHRIGQLGTVMAYYLVARGTAEEKICRIVQEKQEVLSAVLDGGPTAEDLSVFDLLMEEMRSEVTREMVK